jgi:hypothetical protein
MVVWLVAYLVFSLALYHSSWTFLIHKYFSFWRMNFHVKITSCIKYQIQLMYYVHWS